MGDGLLAINPIKLIHKIMQFTHSIKTHTMFMLLWALCAPSWACEVNKLNSFPSKSLWATMRKVGWSLDTNLLGNFHAKWVTVGAKGVCASNCSQAPKVTSEASSLCPLY